MITARIADAVISNFTDRKVFPRLFPRSCSAAGTGRGRDCGMAESSWGKLNLISDFLEDIVSCFLGRPISPVAPMPHRLRTSSM